MQLQEIANQLPDAFTDTKRVTKSYIPAVNAPARIEIPKGQPENEVTNESKTRLKRGRPIGSKDKNPRKKKEQISMMTPMWKNVFQKKHKIRRIKR